VFLMGIRSCHVRSPWLSLRLVPFWGARAHQVVRLRLASSTCARRAASRADGTTLGSHAWLPPWPRGAGVARL